MAKWLRTVVRWLWQGVCGWMRHDCSSHSRLRTERQPHRYHPCLPAGHATGKKNFAEGKGLFNADTLPPKRQAAVAAALAADPTANKSSLVVQQRSEWAGWQRRRGSVPLGAAAVPAVTPAAATARPWPPCRPCRCQPDQGHLPHIHPAHVQARRCSMRARACLTLPRCPPRARRRWRRRWRPTPPPTSPSWWRSSAVSGLGGGAGACR